MGVARRITVQFIGDASSLNRATDSAGRSTSTLGDKMKRVGRIAGVALAAGAVLAAKGLFEATKAAAADQAAQDRLAQTLRNATRASAAQIAGVESWISAQGRALGVTDDELRPAMEKLVIATGDVAKAQRLASLAMDVSAGTGKSLESVSAALAKAQNGNVSALSRLGIATKDASGNTMSFAQVTKSLGDTFGGQAATKAGTFEGMMGRLRLIFDETKETIGMKLLPVVTRFAAWFLRDGIPAISRFVGTMKATLGPVLRFIGDLFRTVTGGLRGDASKNFGMVTDIVREVTSTVRSLWGRFGGQITTIAKSAFGLIKSIIGGGLQVIRGIVKVVSGLIKGDWGKVWSGIKDILKGAWRIILAVIKNAMTTAKAVLSAAWGVVKSIVGRAWDGIKNAVRAGVDKVVDWVTGLKDRVVEKVTSMKDRMVSAGRDIIGGLLSGIKARAGEVLDYMRNLATDALNAVKEKLGINSPSREFQKVGHDTVDGFTKGLSDRKGDIKKKMKEIFELRGEVMDSFKSSFGQSVFSADFGGSDGTEVPTVQGMIEWQRAQAAKAAALRANVAKLIKAGLSKDLLQEMLGAGESGAAQIAALASGSASDIAQLNALNASTNASLSAAGSRLGSALHPRARGAGRDERPIVVQLHIDGRRIHEALVRRKRQTGMALGLA